MTDNNDELGKLMDDISDNAQAQGLTPDKLSGMLDKKDVFTREVAAYTLKTWSNPATRPHYFEMDDSFLREFFEKAPVTKLTIEKPPYCEEQNTYELFLVEDDGRLILFTMNPDSMRKLVDYLLKELESYNG